MKHLILIITGILGFAIAPGPVYAGDLADCVRTLDIAKGCYTENTTTLKDVIVSRFQGHDVQCLIVKNPGNARLFVSATTFGFLQDGKNRNRTCAVTITGVGGVCDGLGGVEQNLSHKDYAAWSRLATAECRDEL